MAGNKVASSTALRACVGRMLRTASAGCVLALCAAAGAADIVIGQSLTLSGEDVEIGRVIRSGAEAYVGHVNATGGMDGRRLRLVTLDDRGDVDIYRRNIEALITKEGAVAIVNCVGDRFCRIAAEVADARGVPLVGAMSGSPELMRPGRMVFSLRPGYAVEAEALARQLQSVGVARVALVTEAKLASDQQAVLAKVFAEVGLNASVLTLASATESDLEALLHQLEAGGYDAAVLEFGASTYAVLAQRGYGTRQAWPGVIATLAGPTLRLLATTFRGRMVGFTMLVPNPDSTALPVVRAFQHHVELYSEASALYFDGFEAYLNLRVCAEALARAGGASPDKLVAALDRLSSLDLGGFTVRVTRGERDGPEWVDVGVVSRSGLFLN